MSSVEILNVHKTYKLYPSPRARLAEFLLPWRRNPYSEFVALNGISLSIERGETFALIGRNGAGKSTLLKILAGVVTPNSGKIRISGNVVALLELGAGFNPEMTGRENVILFGALHGFTARAMMEKFDNIVTFAEIGPFIDQPVKTYSSGMFVRLAFACAIHLDPDVFIVDEALAVGDVRFQQKCFKLIENLKAQGTTIILVSHDLSLIKMVSDRAALIDQGHLIMVGHPKDVANRFFDLNLGTPSHTKKGESAHVTVFDRQSIEVRPSTPTFGQGIGVITDLKIQTSGIFPAVEGHDKLQFTLKSQWECDRIEKLRTTQDYADNIILGVSLSDRYGNYVFGMTTIDKDRIISTIDGSAETTFNVIMPQLKSDDYLLNISMALGTQEHHTSICWYEGIYTLQYRSTLKNVYGWMAPNYEVI